MSVAAKLREIVDVTVPEADAQAVRVMRALALWEGLIVVVAFIVCVANTVSVLTCVGDGDVESV